MRYSLNVKRPCDVCEADDFEHLMHIKTHRIPDLKQPVAICRNCGLVTLHPRLSTEDYKKINLRWFSETFSTDPPEDADEDKKFRKWRIMWDRIEGFFPQDPKRILDIGAGQGWAIEFLQKKIKDIEAVAIEQWEPSQEYITKALGARVVPVDITDDWPEDLKKSFDLIIFRHTLEHLEQPMKTLKQIEACLNGNGFVYMVVPNVLDITHENRLKYPVRTNFFRPVHLHYFNRFTLEKIARKCGLVPVKIEADGEIWGLFKSISKGENRKQSTIPNSYKQQKEFLLKWLQETRMSDIWAFTRIKFRQVIPAVILRIARKIVRG